MNCHYYMAVDGFVKYKFDYMPESDKARLEAVHQFLQIDFDKMKELQDIAELAAQLCEKPVALITLLDKDVNWIKVRTGIDMDVMPRETSFCQYSILQNDILVIPDATKDSRFDENPLVHEDPNVRFYAGAPLVINNGLKLGTLCLFDLKPNKITPLQAKTLSVLARQVTFILELELSRKILQAQVKEIENQNKSLRRIAHIQSHDIRGPLASIMGLVNTIKEDNYKADKERLMMIDEAAMAMDKMIYRIVKYTERKYLL
jgi:GAF domain-containing protein